MYQLTWQQRSFITGTHRGSPHSFPRTSPVWLLCLPRSRHLSHWIQMAQQETSQIILTLACFVNSHPQFYQESDSMCVWSQWSLLCDVTSCWCLCGSWYLCTLRHRPEPEQAPPCHQSRSFCHELDVRGNISMVNAVAECYHAMPMWIKCNYLFFSSRFIVLFWYFLANIQLYECMLLFICATQSIFVR